MQQPLSRRTKKIGVLSEEQPDQTMALQSTARRTTRIDPRNQAECLEGMVPVIAHRAVKPAVIWKYTLQFPPDGVWKKLPGPAHIVNPFGSGRPSSESPRCRHKPDRLPPYAQQRRKVARTEPVRHLVDLLAVDANASLLNLAAGIARRHRQADIDQDPGQRAIGIGSKDDHMFLKI